jgi:hypothetical protein
LPDAAAVPIVVPQDVPAATETDERADADDVKALPQAEG